MPHKGPPNIITLTGGVQLHIPRWVIEASKGERNPLGLTDMELEAIRSGRTIRLTVQHAERICAMLRRRWMWGEGERWGRSKVKAVSRLDQATDDEEEEQT